MQINGSIRIQSKFHIVALELGNWQIFLSIVESIRSSWKIALTWIYIFRGFSWTILFACRNDGELVSVP